ncbi:MAG: hypothetical protein VKO39_08475 [Cyanobacteriota bacterium]|nr:hypothetical protein [Cyanobacteriota bacterium]
MADRCWAGASELFCNKPFTDGVDFAKGAHKKEPFVTSDGVGHDNGPGAMAQR